MNFALKRDRQLFLIFRTNHYINPLSGENCILTMTEQNSNSGNNDININLNFKITRKHLAIGLVAGLAMFMIVPFQIYAQSQDTEPFQELAVEDRGVNAPIVTGPLAPPINSIFVTPSNSLPLGESYYTIQIFPIFVEDPDNLGNPIDMGSIEIAFPPGFNIANAQVMELAGGSGGLGVVENDLPFVVAGQTLTIDTMNVGTDFAIDGEEKRVVINGIVNGFTVVHQIAVTLNDDDGVEQNGPTLSDPFRLRRVLSANILDEQVRTQDIATSAVTAVKVSPDFMKMVTLEDNAAGHAAGWDPDGDKFEFTIIDANVDRNTNMLVQIAAPLDFFGSSGIGDKCVEVITNPGEFTISCGRHHDTSSLHYIAINFP